MFGYAKEEMIHRDIAVIAATIEGKYGIKLPDIWKEFYSNYDGRRSGSLVLRQEDGGYGFAEMIPLTGEGGFEDIVKMDREDGLLPISYFPLGYDPGGNYFYWDSDTDRVYLVYSDDYDNPVPVAISMDDFSEMLDRAE